MSIRPPRPLIALVVGTVVCVAALGAIYFALEQPGSGSDAPLQFMPTVNAALNTCSAVLLILGFVAIRRRKILLHQTMMLSAFGSSSLFFIGYLTYHYIHGDTAYPPGSSRTLYLTILASHVVLSIALVPLVLSTLYLAWIRRFDLHRRVARWTLPIWLYVSITGVVVYGMLRVATGA